MSSVSSHENAPVAKKCNSSRQRSFQRYVKHRPGVSGGSGLESKGKQCRAVDLVNVAKGSKQSWFIPIDGCVEGENSEHSAESIKPAATAPSHQCNNCLRYKTFRKKTNQSEYCNANSSISSDVFDFIKTQCIALDNDSSSNHTNVNEQTISANSTEHHSKCSFENSHDVRPTTIASETTTTTTSHDGADEKCFEIDIKNDGASDHFRIDTKKNNSCHSSASASSQQRPNQQLKQESKKLNIIAPTSHEYFLLLDKISEQNEHIAKISFEVSKMKENSQTSQLLDSVGYSLSMPNGGNSTDANNFDPRNIQNILSKHEMTLKRLCASVDILSSDIRYMKMELLKLSNANEDYAMLISERLQSIETSLMVSGLVKAQKNTIKSCATTLNDTSHQNFIRGHFSFDETSTSNDPTDCIESMIAVNEKNQPHKNQESNGQNNNNHHDQHKNSFHSEIDLLLAHKRELESKMSKIPLRQQRDFEILAGKLEVVERKLASQRIALQQSRRSFSNTFYER